MKIFDTLDLTAPGVVIGNHGIWLPAYKIKVPFQWGGKVTKYSRQERLGSRDTIVDEVAILRALAQEGCAPPVGDLVFFRNVISNYLGAWHCDPCGAYGYEIEDANKLPRGRFDRNVMQALPINGSAAAWGDVLKRDNIINGYLVDVRRSPHDLLKWDGPREMLPTANEPIDHLRARVHRQCQFPAGERELAYQDFWLDGKLERGQRRVVERAHQLGFHPERGEGVLDIGSQSGSFLQYAHNEMQGEGRLVGVEMSPEYVDCARALARSCNQNICFRQMNVLKERGSLTAWIKSYFPHGIQHLLLLSMEKHLGESFIWGLVDELKAKNTYIETNAVAEDKGTGPEPAGPMKFFEEVISRGGTYLGPSRDRNLRRLYRISKQ